MTATKKTADTSGVKTSDVLGVADTALLKPDELAPATDVAASGALIEPTIVERIDVSHPAVDNEPRKGQPVMSNQIDFNDPGKPDAEAVEQALSAQRAAPTADEKKAGE